MHNLIRHGTPPFPAAKVVGIKKDLVSTLTSIVAPLEIYVFGSLASGRFDAYSDVDVLLVFEDEQSADSGRRRLHRDRPRIPFPMDIVCIDRATFLEKSRIGGVCFVAATEGERIFPAQ
jgi:hypothetical protein